MKKLITFAKTIFLFVIFLTCSKILANTNYVSLSGSHTPPFDTWSKAATNIQAAVDMAIEGDLVLVTNGTYKGIGHEINDFGFSVVSITNAITVKSVNGAKVTIVDGEKQRRPFYVGNGTVLDGFILTNGWLVADSGGNKDMGGGAICVGSSTIKNCNIVNNYAWSGGGGIYCYYGGTVMNCRISYNIADHFCGGISAGNFVSNCIVNANKAKYFAAGIGINEGIIVNSIVINNSVFEGEVDPYTGGGGIFASKGAIIDKCVITNNTSYKNAGVYSKRDAMNSKGVNIYNSLIANNIGVYGAGIGSFGSDLPIENLVLENCTIVNNYATNSGGGLYAFRNSDVRNCIIYNNHGGDVVEMNRVDIDYSCIGDGYPGTGNISNNPAFVNPDAGNYRLRNDSPCINSGTNKWIEWWETPISSNDLAGNTRIHAGKIDMGCFEKSFPKNLLSD